MRHDYPVPAMLIASRWISAEGRDGTPVLNPATGDILARIPVATPDEVQQAIEAATASFPEWRDRPAMDRSGILRRTAELLRQRSALIASTISLELGKPLPEALREVETAAELFDWSAEEARRAYGRIIPGRAAGQLFQAILEPIGPVAAFSPWNAPAITPARKISGALGAGCTVVLKAAEETPATAALIVRCVLDAGAPPGVVALLFGNPAAISSQLLSSPDMKVLTFTGSTPVGRQLAALAGANLMRMTLELGGHAPVLVFDDCDPEALAKAAVAAKYRNAGQVCTSPTRFFVQQALYPRFVARFRELTAEIRVGNPFEADTQMGPLATDRRVDAVLDLVNDARACGAEVQGGAILSGPGNFLTPAVIARPPAGCLAAVEEPFGPIALISPFKSPEEAIEQANGLPQALAAYGFTQNARTIALLRTQLDAGSLAINHWQASWPETPFGGRGASGFGAEGGVEGLQAFQQIKFISQV